MQISLTEIKSGIFHTTFMGTQNSSLETRNRAKALSNNIGSYHIDMNIEMVVHTLTNLFSMVTNFKPRYLVHGGTQAEDTAMQNIQARLRMVISYFLSQLLPTVRNRPGDGTLLVLGTANVDET